MTDPERYPDGSADRGDGEPTPRQLSRLVAATAVVTGLAVGVVTVGWDGQPTAPSLSGIAAGFLAVVVVSRRTLARASETAGPQPITAATWVTLARGWLLIAFAGVVLTGPAGDAGAWVAAGLFAGAAALDAVDGAVARRRNAVSEFGGRLDTEMDALLVLAGTAAAVYDGSAPLVFLAVGLARYAFVAGIRLRRVRGLPVTALHPSQFRRATGAVVMTTAFLALAPVPGPTFSWWIAAVVSVPVLGHFGWDWLAVSGRIDTGAGESP